MILRNEKLDNRLVIANIKEYSYKKYRFIKSDNNINSHLNN